MSSPQVEDASIQPFNPFYIGSPSKPIIVHQNNDYDSPVFSARPYTGVLLFDNADSDARDHAANERSEPLHHHFFPLRKPENVPPLTLTAFLSWLRLSTYMAVVSVAITISFHLKHRPTDMERRMALPFGIIFWILSLACLVSGLSNYIRTVTKYSRRQALVQSGWKTQLLFTVVAVSIVAACVLFLSTNATTK
ncbi:hypothetical protein CAC42_6217 [Sphaceloma murrayae]|uniref:DUF202 domain-containing protein n=1 Tax=Sphaceloma murrayae TaxID=2082308 RepID=A0A2K1QTW9_9PEZI|nr:hypothetical protein CAC42_6217 [Sphaceloma murrayae]